MPRAREIFAELVAETERRKPAAALLVDFPEFNLRLAPKLARLGVPVVYYVSPQLWSWRRGRVAIVRRAVERMLVLFPFEVDFYREHGVRAVHVGHPLVDEVPPRPHVWEEGDPTEAGRPYRVALLPGSRGSEIESLLPVMLETVRRLSERLPVLPVLVRAPTIERERLEEAVRLSGLEVAIAGRDREERLAALSGSHAALCASGTATLEVGLAGTPMVVVYRLGRWSWRLARVLVRARFVSLVNLVLGREAVPERLQDEAEPATLARELEGLLTDTARRHRMRADLAELRAALGEPGASGRAADEVAALLRRDREEATS